MNTSQIPPQVSINRADNSPYWMTSFIGPDGKQKRRSTKVPVAGGIYQGEKLSAKQAEKRALLVAGKIAEAEYAEHHSHDNTTVREHLVSFGRRKARHLAAGSIRNNATSFNNLMTWLGQRADEPLRLFTRADAKLYLEARRAVARCGTVTREAGCLKVAFEDAVDMEIIDRNPWRNIRVPADKGDEKVTAEAFTLEEIRYIIANFPPEWSSAVRCSFETYGQRLGDIRTLRWNQFDWEARVVRFVTGKTGRVMAQPMRPAFYSWARAQYEAGGCRDDAFLHPRLAKASSTISSEFTLLLEVHGIGEKRLFIEGKRKAQHTKTFHSVRRAAATLLHSSGVTQAMAMKLVGHNSEAIHSVYVKPDAELLMDAACSMPELGV